MSDVLMMLVVVAFFAVAVAYAHGCDRV